MFSKGKINDTDYNGKYEVDSDSVLMNSTFDGGIQLFFGLYDRYLFMDINSETKQCYGLSIILDAVKFKNVNYDLKEYEFFELYNLECDERKLNICDEMELNFYVDENNSLIIIGDLNCCETPICFFDNTFAVIKGNKLKTLIIKVDSNIINSIKHNTV